MKQVKCKFCGNDAPANMQGYCQVCYRYFILEGKDIYPLPAYGEVTYAPNGDCICPECGKAFRKLGNHIRQSHNMLCKEFFPKHGWHIRKTKATNKDYRKHMRDIQDPLCITKNLLENGKSTRFMEPNGNQMQLPTHSMKSRCSNCVCLVEDSDGDWYCDEARCKCKYVTHCPEKQKD